MGRPKGSQKAKHIEIDGRLERPARTEDWERQLVLPRLEGLLEGDDDQTHARESDSSEVDNEP